MENERFDALLGMLGELVVSLDRIARNTQPAAPEEPDMQRPIEAFVGFDWDSIEATVVKADEFGAALLEHSGRLWTRRSPANKFGEAIWFSRPDGKDAEGNVKYLRLITFRKVADAEPLSPAAAKALRDARPTPAPAQAKTPVRLVTLAASTGDADFAALQGASQERAERPEQKLIASLRELAAKGPQTPLTEPTSRKLWANLGNLTGRNESAAKWLIRAIFDVSHKDITTGQAVTLCNWINCRKQGDAWVPAQAAIDGYKLLVETLRQPALEGVGK